MRKLLLTTILLFLLSNLLFAGRYYDAAVGRFLQVDPHASKYPSWSPYNYTYNIPLKFVDPDGKDAIPIVFKDYKISAYGRKWSGLGHAGVLLINNKTGYTKYYEYGRYNSDKGDVRSYAIPNVVMDSKTGMPTESSLNKVLNVISKKSGKGGKITGAYIKNDNFKEMNDSAQDKLKQNNDPNRKSYGITDNNCGTFVKETLEAGEVDTPVMIDPRPNSYIEEIRDDNTNLDYDPEKNKIIIEQD